MYPLKSKDQAFQSFTHFRALFEKTGEHKIQELRSDNGGEYVNVKFKDYLLQSGIEHDLGPPHSPELNSVAERAKRTLAEKVRCLLTSSRTPKMFWADALRHIMFSFNSVPCHTPGGFNSPNNINELSSIDPNNLRPFGCLVWYKVPEAGRKKLDPKGRASMLLSYIEHNARYFLWDLKKKCAVKSRDVLFVENVFPYNTSLISPPASLLPVEIEWASSRTPSKLAPPPAPPVTTSDPSTQPLTVPHRVSVTPVKRRLQDSIHAPENRRHAHLVPLPDSDEEADASPPPPPATPAPQPQRATTPVPEPERPVVLHRRRPNPPSPAVPRRSTRTSTAPDKLGTWAK